jgi:hypothetical protein
MGHINYRVMIVTSPPDEAEGLREQFFKFMFDELSRDLDDDRAALMTEKIVSKVFVAPVNGDNALIFIAPTGSKEGWAPAEAWKRATRKIEQHCEKTPGAIWALVSMGGDDDEVGMVRTKYSKGEWE